MTYKLEKVVKKQIKDLLNKLGIWSFMPMQSMGKGGVPDHIACMPVTITQDMVGQTVGLFVGIEAKAMNGKLSSLQKIQLDAITEARGVGMVVTGTKSEPGNFIEFEQQLREMKG